MKSASIWRWGRTVCSLVVGLLLVAGCQQSSTQAQTQDTNATKEVPEQKRFGGTAVLGGRGEIPTLNPLLASDYVADQLIRYGVFAPLVRVSTDLQARPWVAKDFTIDRREGQATITLRRDVQWHDGEPLTAEDVAFTFRMIKNPDVPFPHRSMFSGWKSVEVVNDYKLVFEIGTQPNYMYGWAKIPPLPKHVLDSIPPGQLQSSPFGQTMLVGNGPFQFVEHSSGSHWTFRANPDFPEKLGGRPYLDRVVYRVIPEQSTLLASFQTGDIDFYMQVPPRHAKKLIQRQDANVLTYDFPSYTAITWNTRRPFFQDPEVRRALVLALNRKAMLETLRQGFGQQASGPVGPWHWAHQASWQPLAYRPDSARNLLERAGWRDRDGDGVREKEGQKFSFEIITNSNQARQDLAIMAQAQLKKVGIEAQPRTLEYATLIQTLTGPERNFDAAVIGMVQGLVVDGHDQWSCTQQHIPMHLSGYCNPELDPVLDSLRLASDRKHRTRLLEKYHLTLREEQPTTFIFHKKRLNALQPGLKNVKGDIRGDLLSLPNWWIHPRHRP